MVAGDAGRTARRAVPTKSRVNGQGGALSLPQQWFGWLLRTKVGKNLSARGGCEEKSVASTFQSFGEKCPIP